MGGEAFCTFHFAICIPHWSEATVSVALLGVWF